MLRFTWFVHWIHVVFTWFVHWIHVVVYVVCSLDTCSSYPSIVVYLVFIGFVVVGLLIVSNSSVHMTLMN